MKYLALAMLLVIMQASPPAKRQTTNSHTGAGRSVQQQAQPDPTNSGQTTIVFQSNGKPADKADAAKNDTPRWYDPLERSDWWLVIIAALTGIAIAYQAREMKRATAEMEKSARAAADNIELFVSKERARLLVTIKYDDQFFQFDRITKLEPLDLVYEVVKLEIAQHGPTKAFNVSGKAKVFLCDSKVQTAEPEPMDLPPIIEGGATPVVDAVHIPISTEDELDAIKNERLFVHLFGEVAYEDIFGRPHRTPFRYIWQVSEMRMGEGEEGHWEDTSGWMQWGSLEDNRAT